MQERRDFVRWAGRRDVLLDIEGDPPRRMACTLADVSYSGIAVCCPEEVERGARVSVSLPVRMSIRRPSVREGRDAEPDWLGRGEVLAADVEGQGPLHCTCRIRIRLAETDARRMEELIQSLQGETREWCAML